MLINSKQHKSSERYIKVVEETKAPVRKTINLKDIKKFPV